MPDSNFQQRRDARRAGVKVRLSILFIVLPQLGLIFSLFVDDGLVRQGYVEVIVSEMLHVVFSRGPDTTVIDFGVVVPGVEGNRGRRPALKAFDPSVGETVG